MPLHEVLATRRDEVLRRWRLAVEGTIAPDRLQPSELVDHLPGFLAGIVSTLREDAGLPPHQPCPEVSAMAAAHGAERLRLGFSLDAIVREYGALRRAVVATARDAGEPITSREIDILGDAIIAGIARAVTEYTQGRDAQLTRLANEHYAFIAHELRNPLSSAMMAFQLLKRKGLLPSEGATVRALERGLESTNQLIDQTLSAARVASGIELHREPASLKALLEEAELGVVAEAEAKGIELQLSVDGEERIDVDRNLVASALGNLLRNGVKYSHAGGTVEARGRLCDHRVTIEVADSCGGLPPGKVEELFAPFARHHDGERGFGLGLAIAKQAMDAHGGAIRVQNVPPRGCIFILELPAG